MRAGIQPLIQFGGIAVALVLGLVPFTGCVRKSTADARAQAAFIAGQQAALLDQSPTPSSPPPRTPVVTLMGPVNRPVINWTQGLMLSQAILNAGYNVPNDPKLIVIHRSGTDIPIDPKRLLAGEDISLHPGDVVEFQQ
jgi:hypothetical protein